MGCLVCVLIDMLKPVDEKTRNGLIEELRNDLEQFHPKRKEQITVKKEDFSYECNSSGYMIMYKGQSIGGAGAFNHLHEPVGQEVQKQIEKYREFAKNAIENILSGNPGYIYKEAIDRVNRSEGV